MSKPRQKAVLLSDIHTILVKNLFKQNIPDDVIVKENPRTIIHYHTYGGLSQFFRGLAGGRLMGTICIEDKCRATETGIWLPPRVHCPDCWEKMYWAEINTNEAAVYAHSTTNYPGAGFKASAPCPLISVKIPGVCTKFMSYLSEFGEGEPYIGMPVRPVFNTEKPTYTIIDISWIPRD